MGNETDVTNLPLATVVRKKTWQISIVWIIPLLAAVIAIGIAIQRIRNEGPTVTIVFKDAAGIEAGKTFIKYKAVTIGEVTAVQYSEDSTKVLVTARIAAHAAGLMVEEARFWVVRPHVSLSGVSGLSTLPSGQYIGVATGKSVKKARNFIALSS
jgi:paraquat-inducible protein B